MAPDVRNTQLQPPDFYTHLGKDPWNKEYIKRGLAISEETYQMLEEAMEQAMDAAGILGIGLQKLSVKHIAQQVRDNAEKEFDSIFSRVPLAWRKKCVHSLSLICGAKSRRRVRDAQKRQEPLAPTQTIRLRRNRRTPNPSLIADMPTARDNRDLLPEAVPRAIAGSMTASIVLESSEFDGSTGSMSETDASEEQMANGDDGICRECRARNFRRLSIRSRSYSSRLVTVRRPGHPIYGHRWSCLGLRLSDLQEDSARQRGSTRSRTVNFNKFKSKLGKLDYDESVDRIHWKDRDSIGVGVYDSDDFLLALDVMEEEGGKYHFWLSPDWQDPGL